jgi:hypothetical protein
VVSGDNTLRVARAQCGHVGWPRARRELTRAWEEIGSSNPTLWSDLWESALWADRWPVEGHDETYYDYRQQKQQGWEYQHCVGAVQVVDVRD